MDGARGDAVAGLRRRRRRADRSAGGSRSRRPRRTRSCAARRCSGPPARPRRRRHGAQQRAPLDAHAGLGQAHVGRGEVAGAGQLVAGDVVLRDRARPASPSSSARATPIGPPIGSNSDDRRRRPAARRARRGRRRRRAPTASSSTSYSRAPGRPPGALHHDRRRRRRDVGRVAELDVDAEPARLGDQPVDERAVRARRTAAIPPSVLGALDDRARRGRGSRRPGRPPARPAPPPTTTTVARRARRPVPVGILGLAAARRLADARDDRVARVAHLARLVAAGARPDRGRARRRAAWRRGRGRRSGPGSSRRRRTRRIVVPPTAHSAWPTSTIEPCRNTGDVDAPRPHGAAHVDVEAGRLVEVGPGLLDREDRARARRRGSRRRRRPASAAMSGAMLRRDARPTAPARRTTGAARATPSAPTPARTAAITSRAKRRRSGPHSSSRWLVSPLTGTGAPGCAGRR